jgi:uncharacterized protein YkwD
MQRYTWKRGAALGLACLVATLAGCGGGGDSGTPATAPGAGTSEQSGPAAPGTPAQASPGSASTAGAPAAATPAPAPVTSVAPVSKTFADQTLERINAVRAVARKCGAADAPAVGPLVWQAQTEQAALSHAQYLQQNNLFSHTGTGGSNVGDRLTATGYVWQTVGENIAAGYTDLATVVQGWLDSPGHCVNLMNASFTDLGVALVNGTSSNTYRTYWGMVLARPR